MRVFLFATTSLEAPFFRNLAAGLRGRGLEVDGSSLFPGPPVARSNAPTADTFSSLEMRSRFAYPFAALRLARLLRQRAPDVLHAHLFDAGLVGVVAGHLAGTRVVVLSRHHMDEAWLLGARAHVALDRWMARRADAVIAVSGAVKAHMVEREGIAAGKIEVIRLGFDFASLSPTAADRRRVREELGGDSGYVIGCIGRLFRNKGQQYLLQAARALVTQIPDLRLVLVGSGDRTPLERMARDHGLADRITFLGHRTDVPACIAAMDLVVHPSLSEAFSQVIVETMAVGTPLIATQVGGAAEVIQDGETGMLVPPADVEAMRAAISRLHGDRRRAEYMAAAGRAFVRSQFTVERTVDEHARFYERVLDRRSVSH